MQNQTEMLNETTRFKVRIQIEDRITELPSSYSLNAARFIALTINRDNTNVVAYIVEDQQ